MLPVLLVVYVSVLCILSLYIIIQFPKLDKATRIIGILVWLGLTTEILGFLAGKYYHNNMPVYNISAVLEWILTCLYFNYSVLSFTRKRVGWYFAAIVLLIGIVSWLSMGSLLKMNDRFIACEAAGIIGLSLYALYRLLLTDRFRLDLHRKVHFWIPLVFLVYQMGTLWSWVAYQYLWDNQGKKGEMLHLFLLGTNIVTYTAWTILFIAYPKFINAYVS